MSVRALAATLTVAVYCSIALSAGASADAAKKLDYAWWRAASPDARAAAVRAAIGAGQLGWLLGFERARGDISRAIVVTKAHDAALYALYHTPTRVGPVYPESLEYYVAAVDRLYAKYPPLRKREVDGIVFTCLPSNPSKTDCDRLLKGGW